MPYQNRLAVLVRNKAVAAVALADMAFAATSNSWAVAVVAPADKAFGAGVGSSVPGDRMPEGAVGNLAAVVVVDSYLVPGDRPKEAYKKAGALDWGAVPAQ